MSSKVKVVILGSGGICALGDTLESIIRNYQSGVTNISSRIVNNKRYPVYEIDGEITLEKDIPRVASLGLRAAKEALKSAQSNTHQYLPPDAVIVGTARGATENLEELYHQFSQNGRCSPNTSPITTFGAIASYIADNVKCTKFNTTVSATCNSSFIALELGYQMVQSGSYKRVLVIGTESPLTEFSLAQMIALRLYANYDNARRYPVLPLSQKTSNTLTLGEGAGALLISSVDEDFKGVKINHISSQREEIDSLTGISKDGNVLQSTMREVIEQCGEPDMILAHAPGTLKGDKAELSAIRSLELSSSPIIYSNKHLLGHTFGASGMLSLLLGCFILEKKLDYLIGYNEEKILLREGKDRREINNIMCNSLGFGGGGVSVGIAI